MALSYQNKLVKTLPPSEQARRDRRFAWERSRQYVFEYLSTHKNHRGVVVFFNPCTESGLLEIFPANLLPSGSFLRFEWPDIIPDAIGRRYLKSGTVVSFDTDVLSDEVEPGSEFPPIRIVNVRDVSEATTSLDPEAHIEISTVGDLIREEHRGILFRGETGEPVDFELTSDLEFLQEGDSVRHKVGSRFDDLGRLVWFAYEIVRLPQAERHVTHRAELSEHEKENLKAQTEEFGAWFAKSRIVDCSGKPLVCYHGTMTPVPIEAFQVGSQYDDAHYPVITSVNPNAYLGPHFLASAPTKNPFDDPRRVANMFACGDGELWLIERRRKLGRSAAPCVYPVYLKIENPCDFGSENTLNDLVCRGFISGVELLKIAAAADGLSYPEFLTRYHMDPDYRIDVNWRLLKESFESFGFEDTSILEDAAAELASQAKSKLFDRGYDGIVYTNTLEGGCVAVPIRDPAQQIRFAIPNAQFAQALCEEAETKNVSTH